MWSQMFQLPPKMAQSRSPDSADAPDSEAVAVCMIYCFKGCPARRCCLWRRKLLWFILLNKRWFSSQEVARGRCWMQSKDGLRSPASICTSLTYFYPSIFLFPSPFYHCFSRYVPLLHLHKPARSSLICLYSLVPPCFPLPSPLVLASFIFFCCLVAVISHLFFKTTALGRMPGLKKKRKKWQFSVPPNRRDAGRMSMSLSIRWIILTESLCRNAEQWKVAAASLGWPRLPL